MNTSFGSTDDARGRHRSRLPSSASDAARRTRGATPSAAGGPQGSQPGSPADPIDSELARTTVVGSLLLTCTSHPGLPRTRRTALQADDTHAEAVWLRAPNVPRAPVRRRPALAAPGTRRPHANRPENAR